MQNQLLEWIFECASKMLLVSRKLPGKNPLWFTEIWNIDPDGYDEKFEASSGWLFKFVKQHNLLLQREISVA